MSEEKVVNILNRLSLDNVNISDEVNRLVKMDKDEHQFLPGPSRKGETELCKIKKTLVLTEFVFVC